MATRSESSYHVGLLGAARPEGPHDDQEQHHQEDRHDRDDGHVAGLGQRGRVGGLGRNHVGEVQHVAQRPAGVASFDLHEREETGE